ncbi:MAG TPA: hypothetical protein VH301_08450 [Usitatibacter sp.]|nr:hypothetical protein [Usitatibacter sp.]
MKNRTELPAADLYVLLQRELRRRQPAQCQSCFMQLPFRVDRRDADAPNWEVVAPPLCDHGCAEVIEDLVFEFGLQYDLKPDDERGAH